MAGIKNASVLPDPVLEIPIKSLPDMMIGRPCACMGVNSLKPWALIVSMMKSGKSLCWKEKKGSGGLVTFLNTMLCFSL